MGKYVLPIHSSQPNLLQLATQSQMPKVEGWQVSKLKGAKCSLPVAKQVSAAHVYGHSITSYCLKQTQENIKTERYIYCGRGWIDVSISTGISNNLCYLGSHGTCLHLFFLETVWLSQSPSLKSKNHEFASFWIRITTTLIRTHKQARNSQIERIAGHS